MSRYGVLESGNMRKEIKKPDSINDKLKAMSIYFKKEQGYYLLTLQQYGDYIELIEKHLVTKYINNLTGEEKIVCSLPFYKTHIGNYKMIVEDYTLDSALQEYKRLKEIRYE
jgi:hypothetical protein